MDRKTATSSNDRLLTEAMYKGDIKAFESLFDKYYKDLVMYAGSFSLDRYTCEDIVQEVFCNLWERRRKVDVKSAIRQYLITVVRNKCIDEIRHRKIKDLHSCYILKAGIEAEDTTENLILYSELLKKISLAKDEMTEQERECFTMNRIEGKKTSEIAVLLDIPLRTVQHYIYKAMEKISKFIVILPLLVGIL